MVSSNALRLRCIEVVAESHDVKSFHFECINGKAFSHQAGQFLTLDLKLPAETGEPDRIRRCYTISSAPDGQSGAAGSFSITVKAKPEGLVSNWLHRSLRVGTELDALPPGGTFCIAARTPQKYLFVCGGVGITPVLAMTRWLASGQVNPDQITFVQCARAPQDLLFVDELTRLQQQGLIDLHLLPAEAPADWTGERGKINADYLRAKCPDLLERHLYCCGPDPFMKHVRTLWLDAGGRPDAYFEERFAVETSTDGGLPKLAISPGGAEPSLHLQASQLTVASLGDMTVLEAVRSVGIEIPSSCELGICGTCKIRKLSGRVIQQPQGGIEDEEIEQGWILACCSRVLDEVVIDV